MAAKALKTNEISLDVEVVPADKKRETADMSILSDGKVHCAEVGSFIREDGTTSRWARLCQKFNVVTIDEDTGEAFINTRVLSCLSNTPFDTVAAVEADLRSTEDSLADGLSFSIKTIYDVKPIVFARDGEEYDYTKRQLLPNPRNGVENVYMRRHLVVTASAKGVVEDRTQAPKKAAKK